MFATDAEMSMGEGRALLRVTDFLELARLVARLASTSGHQCEPVPDVSKNTPRTLSKLRRINGVNNEKVQGIYVRLSRQSD